MWKSFCNWLLCKRMGWTIEVTEPIPDKAIICLAPHTSNWDFLIGQLYSKAAGMRSNFLMKKEWFFWPLGSIFRSMGIWLPRLANSHISYYALPRKAPVRPIPNGKKASTILRKRQNYPSCFSASTMRRSSSVAARP